MILHTLLKANTHNKKFTHLESMLQKVCMQ